MNKKKNGEMRVAVLDGEGNVITDGKLSILHIHEAVIIEKSIEFYSDPEPCMIHRSAVMKRLYMEIEETLGRYSRLRVSEIPERVLRYMDLPDMADCIEIK